MDFCIYDHFVFVENALKNKSFNVNYKMKPSSMNIATGLFTPLHAALYKKNIEIAKLLLERPGIEVNSSCIHSNTLNKCELSTMQLAVLTNNYEIVKMILNITGVDVNKISYYKMEKKEPNFKETIVIEMVPLITAIQNQNFEIAKLLLSNDLIDVNIVCTKFRHMSAYLNSRTNEKITPLIASIQAGNQEIIEILLKKPNIDVNTKYFKSELNEEINETPLYMAVKTQNADIVKLLLSHPEIDVNQTSRCIENKNERIETPLFLASKNNSIDIVKYLLENKIIDVNNNSSEKTPEIECYQTALTISLQNNFTEIVNLLLTNPQIDVNLCSVNIVPANDRSAYKVERNTYREKNTITPLYIACKNQNVENVKKLLGCPKIDVNKKSILSINNRSYNMRKGIDDIIECTSQYTCLYISIEKYHEEIARLLISHKNIDVNMPSIIVTNTKETRTNALFCAICNKNNEIAELMINHSKVDFSFQHYQCWDNIEYTYDLLCFAIDKFNLDIAILLISKPQINVNSRYIYQTKLKEERKEMAPIHLSLDRKYTKISKLLLSHPKINLNDMSLYQVQRENALIIEERTIIDHAITNIETEIVNMCLLDHNIDINSNSIEYKSSSNGISYEERKSSLKIAIVKRKVEIFQLLADYALENSLDVNWEELRNLASDPKIREIIENIMF